MKQLIRRLNEGRERRRIERMAKIEAKAIRLTKFSNIQAKRFNAQARCYNAAHKAREGKEQYFKSFKIPHIDFLRF